MISGILPVDKPIGWTSHDAVARVRRVAGQKQVGHAGTLDPLATGVLLLVLGRATRLSQYLMGSPKEYCAEIVLGATTVTDDAETPLQMHADVGHIDRLQIEEVLARFTGAIAQVPPRYAAVKKGGERLYVLARRGEEIEVEPRQVTIERITVERWEAPRLRVRVRCGAGTYIRSLARDVGAGLSVGGYLHALRRISSGGFTVQDCVRLDDLTDGEAVARALVPGERAVIDWPAMALSPDEAEAIRNGRPIPVPAAVHGTIRMYGPSGDLLALGGGASGWVKPFRVFEGERDAGGH